MLGWTPIASALTIKLRLLMFLIDTTVISEARKGRRADAGVQNIWATAARGNTPCFWLPSPLVSCGVGCS
jgi:hypothetical protein